MSGSDTMQQLELFSPHRMDLGEAWDTLAVLNSERAAELFDGLVGRFPESGEAAQGAATAHHWKKVLEPLPSLSQEDHIGIVWTALKQCPQHLMTPRLQRSLHEHLWDALTKAKVPFLPPDLPAGRLALELGRPKLAVKNLNQALRQHPDEPVILKWLAKTEWTLGHTLAARILWLRLMLATPSTFDVNDLPDEELKITTTVHGVGWTPFFGWMEGILPLLTSIPKNAPCSSEKRTYEHVIAAEKARRIGDYPGMVAARQAIQLEAPEILAAYLYHLDKAHPT